MIDSINNNFPLLAVAVELISVEQLAARIGCTRQTVESHRRRGDAHFATWTAVKLGQPWRAIVQRTPYGEKRFYEYRPQ